MKDNFKNTKKSIKDFGEVFTPTVMVEEILNKLPKNLFKENKTFLDNSCGDGQFLFSILKRKMENGFSHKEALSQIYGIELCPKNTKVCKERLLLNSKEPELISLVDRNIINADALDPNHKGWDSVGYMWSNH